MKRNFFAYPTDVSLLTSIAPRLLRESPVCVDKDLSEITAMVQNEPKWFASLDGSLPSRVLDYMYLGNLGHANNPDLLRALGITQILSVGETAMWRDGELEAWGADNVLVIQGVQDNGIDPLTDEFEKCLDFIGKPRTSERHGHLGPLQVGVSRSATICIAEQISTAYWPRFRPDVTDQDKGKGTILDLCDSGDLKNIVEYKAWARSQEMSPVFPRREEVEITLRAALDDIIMGELNTYRRVTAQEDTAMETPTQSTSSSPDALSRDDPWVQQQWGRLPEFRPALLVLGWT
ncbi:hypothetical protein NUW58_g499 [Xylaria curta]|uniref:Uncharacterized protein n=1 Tax=Xylaria curta TaxID=42375 RepID=A0ACC1PSE0_9PEZI|nr:hypothetical protein NUW58_g499 [Xylaria curta]